MMKIPSRCDIVGCPMTHPIYINYLDLDFSIIGGEQLSFFTVDGQNIRPWNTHYVEPPRPKSQCFRARVRQSDVGGFDFFRPLGLMHLKIELWGRGG